MSFKRRDILGLAAATCALASPSRRAWAQAYPSRPVRVIVPFAPGGPADIFGRLVAQKLSARYGKSFYIENLAGAGGNIGVAQAARAAPDGLTIVIVTNAFVINPSMYDTLPFDPIKDFEPVTNAVSIATVLSVNPTVPATTVDALIALVRANPGKYNYTSAGVGTSSHLAGEQFRLALGLDLVHIPFSGAGPAVAAMVAGHTPIGFTTMPPTLPQIRDGKLRALAVTSKTRSRALPEVETMAEAGYPEIEGDSWVGVLVPAGTPKPIVASLQREIVDIVTSADMREHLATIGFDPVGNTPQEFAAQIKHGIDVFGAVIRAGHIK
jgi:tripartite-type tricarboxylate transporter receptor subunit TctC